MVPALPGFPLAIQRGGQEGENSGGETQGWYIAAQQKVRKTKYHWKRNRGNDPGTLFLLQPSCSALTPMAESASPKTLSPASYSLCIFKTGQLAITVRQHRQRLLGIDLKGRSPHAGTFQDNTNDKNRHQFSFKYTLRNDQAGLQPCRPGPKWSLQHHVSRLLILNTARCSMAKAVLLN